MADGVESKPHPAYQRGTPNGKALHLLAVEDDPSLGPILLESLTPQGFQTHLCSCVEEAREVVWRAHFDVFLLDVMLPEGEEAGFDLAVNLREGGFHQPILFLSARESVPDRVKGLHIGDDYLLKPFALAELIARLKALARRGELRPRVISSGAIELEVQSRRVHKEGRAVPLTAKEFLVLELLLLNQGRIYTREEVMDRVWGPGFYTDSNLVDVYIRNLRQKLGEEVIETVRGLGYRSPER